MKSREKEKGNGIETLEDDDLQRKVEEEITDEAAIVSSSSSSSSSSLGLCVCGGGKEILSEACVLLNLKG